MATEGFGAEGVRRLLDYDPVLGVLRWRAGTGSDVGAHEGQIAGYVHDGRYRKLEIAGRRYMAHRVIWLWVTGAWPREQIDHINGMKDDNRWSNLREASSAQNAMNRRVMRTNKAGLKGVHSSKSGRTYWASICVDGRSFYLGSFATKEEAAAVYRQAAPGFHGDFAWREGK